MVCKLDSECMLQINGSDGQHLPFNPDDNQGPHGRLKLSVQKYSMGAFFHCRHKSQILSIYLSIYTHFYLAQKKEKTRLPQHHTHAQMHTRTHT